MFLAIILLKIPKFLEEGLLPLPTSTKDGPINIPGLPPFSAFDLPRDLIGGESSPNYKFYTRNTLRLGDATCILVNTFYELEKNVFDVVESEILNSTMQVCVSASMASLRAELKTMQNEMIAVKEEGDQAMAEKDEQIEEEMTRN